MSPHNITVGDLSLMTYADELMREKVAAPERAAATSTGDGQKVQNNRFHCWFD